MTDVMPGSYGQPDATPEPQASDQHISLGERLAAQAGEAFMGGTRTFTRLREFGQAESGQESLGSQIGRLQHGEDLNDLFVPQEHDGSSFGGPRQPVDVPIADAKARVKSQGLEGTLSLPDQPTIRKPVLDLMLQHAQERRDYDAAVSRGPQGFFPGALGMITEIGAGMIDPVNVAAFSIPLPGAGTLLARAGDSILARGGVKAGIGAAQGAAGSAALIPGDWWLHTKDGQDYTMADALKSVVLGAGMGATFHAGFGSIGDLLARSRGQPLPGSPEDLVLRGLMHGTHVPAAALENAGLPAEEIPGIGVPRPAPSGGEPQLETGLTLESAQNAIPPHPAEILADLPPAAREDVARAAIADVINDRPVRVAEMLQEAAKEDPRIAESLPPVEAFHGSPHEFDRFDSSKIGTGEGAQSYGHGLYFAENEDVARQYSKTTSYQDFIRKVKELYGEHDSPDEAREALEESQDFSAAQRELLKSLEADDFLGFDYPHQAVAAAIKEPGAFDMSERTHEALRNLGNVYKVHIAADRDHFLDWDKPLSEQSQHVRNALENHPDPMIAGTAEKHGAVSGKDFYQRAEQHLRAQTDDFPAPDEVDRTRPRLSRLLQEAGIPGIKYLDQGSRQPFRNAEIKEIGEANARIAEQIAALQRDVDANRANPSMLPAYFTTKEFDIRERGRKIEQNNERLAELQAQKQEGTHNFVVFDDKLIRVTHKNGKEVGLDEMKAARPESVPGPAPGTLRTGRPNVDAALADPIVADAIANGPVNRANDVPYEAGASEGNDPTTHLDHHLPRLVELKSGSFDPAIPAKIHEQIEKRAMELLIAKKKTEVGRELTGKEIEAIYEIAHHEYAEVAEDAWYQSQGLDLKEVNAWWAKQDKITEHENPANPPANLYTKPYPHNVVEGVKHEEKGAAAEWPTDTAVEGASSAGAGDNVVHVRARKATGPRARPEETRSLFEHIAANGGLRDDDAMIPDVKSSLGRDNHFVPGFGNLIRKPGQISTAAARSGARAPMSLDQARESAVHAGYLEDHGEHSGGVSTSSVRDLLDAVDREASGNRVYRRGAEQPKSARDQALHERDLENHMDKTLGDYGVDLDRISSKTRARTLEIMDKEGVTDPLDAYERAVMEADHDGTQAGKLEPFAETIPGWDKPDDAGSAPREGGPVAGGPEAGGPGAGGPARDAGQGDRAAGRAPAARGVADWNKLATARDAVDDPDAVAASKAADKTPEPESVEPTKAVSAAEAAAKEADQLVADILPTLSAAERKVFEKALGELKDDREAREQIVRDGAACLAAAVA